MGKEPTGTGLTPEESAYYRAVEDHFARLRGTVFLINPKDFELLRRWWTEGVPLAAILAGVSEVFERKRQETADPVSSLAYCRHAVARHARRLATTSAGAGAAPAIDVGDALRRLGAAVREAAEERADEAAIAAVLDDLSLAIESLPAEADPAALGETLGRLELAALESVAVKLSEKGSAELTERVDKELAGMAVEGAARDRTERALRLRAVRELLGLPRLELTGGGHG